MCAAKQMTPMMKQYLQIKQEYPDAILFFRLGDFYEMFFEDAEIASQILNITLTSRNKNKEDSIPLCGVPYHAAKGYLRKLIQAGKKVAICEQVEDPKEAKGVVKREVIRVVSPGLDLDVEDAAVAESNYLGASLADETGRHVSWLELATGEIVLSCYERSEEAWHELLKQPVREYLQFSPVAERNFSEKLKKHRPELLLSSVSLDHIDFNSIKNSFSAELLQSRESLKSAVAQQLVDAILSYAYQTQKSELKHIGAIQLLKPQKLLKMEVRTFRHLELTKSLHHEGSRGTLFSVLNQTQTGMGSRRLAKWMHYPLAEKKSIEKRLDAIEECIQKPALLDALQKKLKAISDIERMLGKLALSTLNARDLRALGVSLGEAMALTDKFRPEFEADFLKKAFQNIPDLNALSKEVLSSLLEELPLSIREGALIADGIHAELDELRTIRREGKSFIASLELKERERTKINSLKIRYNKVFGYYIEVTHTYKHLVPEDYHRKQTLANAERFISAELKEYESKVLGAEERIKLIEYEIFSELRQKSIHHLDKIRTLSQLLADIDAIASLAEVARENNYIRPLLSEDSILELRESRHPVLEKMANVEHFIPNDITMDSKEQRFFLITGPNMAGKSTIMRQMALSIVMAQMGSFVPASYAKIGIADQVFTRIGASDDLSQGQSTFMVEMLEAAEILKAATEKSFIILDEIGRGTSTYDGMSIAWAIAEDVAKRIQCRALFATHYHELTDLSHQVEGIVNYQVAVKEWNGQILFLHKLISGGASRSYGIEVARLAGLPEGVIAKSQQVLHSLENAETSALQDLAPQKHEAQLPLFSSAELESQKALLDQIKKIDPNQLSPLEALEFLFKLKEMSSV